MPASEFRKKPVIISAWQVDLLNADDCDALMQWCGGRFYKKGELEAPLTIAIDTLEGRMYADHDDWIIRGVQGEFYPCKPDIFAATYELVPDDPEPDPNEYLSAAEFRDSGLLAEVNRAVLHPLGYAMSVSIGDDGEVTMGPILSGPDPEGWRYGLDDELVAKLRNVERMKAEAAARRIPALGYYRQPLIPADESESVETDG